LSKKNIEVLDKVGNIDKIDKSVDEVIDVMTVIYKAVCDKLEKDGVCVNCKKKIPFKELIMVLANKTPDGVVSILSVCKKCYNEK